MHLLRQAGPKPGGICKSLLDPALSFGSGYLWTMAVRINDQQRVTRRDQN
jgi:hypothetical protein